jgi:hypothetical protein
MCAATPTLDRYQRIAPVYDLLDRSFEYRRCRQIRPLLFGGLSGRILDAGMATGCNMPFYPGEASVVGIDLSPAMSGRAPRRMVRTRARTGCRRKVELRDIHLPQLAAFATFLFGALAGAAGRDGASSRPVRLHASGDSQRVPLTRSWKLIADELGLTREAVYRALSKLERQKVLGRERGLVRLFNSADHHARSATWKARGTGDKSSKVISRALPSSLCANLEGDGTVMVGTMHLAKGLEFKAVAVVACDEGVLPLQSRMEAVADETELDEVYETERHLPTSPPPAPATCCY